MKGIVFLSLLITTGCNSEKEEVVKLSSPTFSQGAVSASAGSAHDDFSDFEKKDEECGEEEDLEKKLEEMKKPATLQGATEEDCTVQ